MRKENQSDGRAHDCDHEQILCAHGLIHAHRKSRVIGVRMAMCTSKPIIGKDAPPPHSGNARKKTFFFIDVFPNCLLCWRRSCRGWVAIVEVGQDLYTKSSTLHIPVWNISNQSLVQWQYHPNIMIIVIWGIQENYTEPAQFGRWYKLMPMYI